MLITPVGTLCTHIEVLVLSLSYRTYGVTPPTVIVGDNTLLEHTCRIDETNLACLFITCGTVTAPVITTAHHVIIMIDGLLVSILTGCVVIVGVTLLRIIIVVRQEDTAVVTSLLKQINKA